mmetsp:Transcript_41557/g.36746  ORF Transcript_41557/g.36746 Transcript_41557/m.36746 type:complete len:110 (-) Transcript_41557:20-349(-)
MYFPPGFTCNASKWVNAYVWQRYCEVKCDEGHVVYSGSSIYDLKYYAEKSECPDCMAEREKERERERQEWAKRDRERQKEMHELRNLMAKQQADQQRARQDAERRHKQQ